MTYVEKEFRVIFRMADTIAPINTLCFELMEV